MNINVNIVLRKQSILDMKMVLILVKNIFLRIRRTIKRVKNGSYN